MLLLGQEPVCESWQVSFLNDSAGVSSLKSGKLLDYFPSFCLSKIYFNWEFSDVLFLARKMRGTKQRFVVFSCKLSIISQLWENYRLTIGRRKTEKMFKITCTTVNDFKL